jgi:hypothetical protein
MTRKAVHDRTPKVLTSTWRRAHEAAAWLQPAAEQVKPLARTARQGANKARTWAAPQVERAGQVLQDSIAPKTSSLLSAAARRIDPTRPRLRRARKLAGASAILAGTAAAAAAVRRRLKASAAPANDAAEATGTLSGAETAPGTGAPDRHGQPDSDALHGSAARTS